MKLTNTKPLALRLPPFNRVHITLVGCGGTGSHIASGLAPISLDLSERGIPCGITLIDPDIVEAKNVGRQLFCADDIGKPKAEVIASRLLDAYGIGAGAQVCSIDSTNTFTTSDDRALNIVIGAVDNPAARALIANAVKKADGRLWWLDCGNENHSGQACIGNFTHKVKPALGFIDALPAPHIIYPDLIKTPKVKRAKRVASCAELTASGEQGLMVNRMAAAWALSMLHDFLLGQLRYFSVAFDTQWGGVTSRIIDTKELAEVTK